MTFLPTRGHRIVPGLGPRDAKIAIVGEAPGAYEDAQLKPFVGPSGQVLEQCIHSAGMIRSEIYLTNVVKVRPPKNDIAPFFNSKTGAFTAAGMDWCAKLWQELNELKPNVIVACGATALAALTGRHRIMKFRGYIFESEGLNPPRKVIGTIHPAAIMRGQYIYRYILAADLHKAKNESTTPELKRPERQLVHNFTTVSEVLEWLEYFKSQPIVCFDIEVLNYEVACIGLCSDPAIACTIPLDARWSEQDEVAIWRGIQEVLGNEKSIKVAQNGIFDIHFLLTRCGIEVKGPIQDTMIAHHIMYPEFPKSLAFLTSLYGGAAAYHKDMVKFVNIKEEA